MGKDKRKIFIQTLLAIFILSFIVVYVPFLNMLALFIWPLPVVYSILKQDTSLALKVILISAVINTLLWGPFMGMVTIVGFGFIGFIIGNCLEAGLSPGKTLAITILAAIISQGILAVAANSLLGLDSEYLLEEISTIIVQTPELDFFQETLVEQLSLLLHLIPAVIICSSTIMGLFHYYITVGYLSKKGFSVDIFTYPRFWRLPRTPILFALGLGLIFSQNIIFMNLSFVVFFLLFLQGFSVGLYFTREILDNNFLYMLFVFLTLILPFMFILLMVIGCLDMIFNLRKINHERIKRNENGG